LTRPGDGGTKLGERGSELATLARGGTLSLIGSVSSSLLGFVLVVVITRGLPKASAGVLFEVIALFMILANTTELGADTGLVRMLSRYRALDRTEDLRPTIAVGLWPVLVIGSLVAAAVYVLAPQLAAVFVSHASESEGVTYIRVFAPFLPLAAATTAALSGTRGFGTMFPYVAVLGVGVPVLRPLLTLAVTLAGLGAASVALAWATPVAAGFALAVASLFGLLRREELRRPPRRPPRPWKELAGEFWRFCAPRGLASFLQVGVFWLSILLVGALRDSQEAGVYAAASRFVGVGTLALQAFGLALAPQVSALLTRGNREEANTLFQTSTWWLMALSWPIYMTLAVFAPLLLRLSFGPGYVEGRTALVLQCIGYLAVVATGNNKIVLLMAGGSGWNLATIAGSLVLNVVLNLVLIPTYGMEGASVAFSVSITLDSFVTTFVVWRLLRVDPFGRGYPVVALAGVLCFGVLGLVVRATLGMTVPAFTLFAVLSTTAYGAILWRFRRQLRLPAILSALRARVRPVEAPVLDAS
jgi:O-antigen/teichoic acid export membrane protein